MSVRTILKSTMPIGMWRTLKTIYTIRHGYRAAYSINRAIESNDITRLYFDGSTYIYEPDTTTAAWIFRRHFWETEQHAELKQFLALSAGCSALIDLGASGGVMSAVFSQSRANAHILSIDPDRGAARVLHQVRDRNRANNRWDIAEVAIGAAAGTASFCSYGYGGQIGAVHAANEHLRDAESNTFDQYDVPVTTLEHCANEFGIVPDLIKIDIESFEMEVVEQALGFLQRHRPRIHLELHNLMIRSRGLDPAALLASLAGIGYRIFDSGKLPTTLRTAGDGPIRVGLHIP